MTTKLNVHGKVYEEQLSQEDMDAVVAELILPSIEAYQIYLSTKTSQSLATRWYPEAIIGDLDGLVFAIYFSDDDQDSRVQVQIYRNADGTYDVLSEIRIVNGIELYRVRGVEALALPVPSLIFPWAETEGWRYSYRLEAPDLSYQGVAEATQPAKMLREFRKRKGG